MAAVQDLDGPSKPASEAPNRSASVNDVLGGGAVADVLLWRRKDATLLAALGATVIWFLFERAGFSLLSVTASSVLLVVIILFVWAKAALILNRFLIDNLIFVRFYSYTANHKLNSLEFMVRANYTISRPLPPLPNLAISDKVADKAADRIRQWINPVLDIAYDITIRRDKKVLLQVVLVLWFISYIGSLFNLLTLVYIGVLVAITFPYLYDKYQDHVDQKLAVAHNILGKYKCILSRKQDQSTNEKKTN